MSGEDWLKAADMLGVELGLAEQRRIIVLHTKKGRTHAHIAWQRYDTGKGRMISDSFSRLAQDRARLAMERVFEHQPTPHRNVQRPQMKELLSALWQNAKTGAAFIQAARKKGYAVAAGVQRRPFMVVDDTGRSFDLVRQLTDVKTKEVRDRLKGERLAAEKDVIAQVRKRQHLQKQQAAEAANDNSRMQEKQQAAERFAESRTDITKDEQIATEDRREELAKGFADTRNEIGRDEEGKAVAGEKKKEEAAQDFAHNRSDTLAPKPESDRERRKREFIQSLQTIRDNNKNRDRGREPD